VVVRAPCWLWVSLLGEIGARSGILLEALPRSRWGPSSVWDVTVFNKNRERRIAGAASKQLLESFRSL
jgi:hypothetical protein